MLKGLYLHFFIFLSWSQIKFTLLLTCIWVNALHTSLDLIVVVYFTIKGYTKGSILFIILYVQHSQGENLM